MVPSVVLRKFPESFQAVEIGVEELAREAVNVSVDDMPSVRKTT
jgi:hypothetical protein